MIEHFTFWKVLIAYIISCFLSLMGGMDNMLYLLLVLICIDYLTGFFGAIIKGKLQANIMFKGIAKKLSLLLIVAMGFMLDTFLFNTQGVLHNGVVIFFCINESISILENSVIIGIKVPPQIRKMLYIYADQQHIDQPPNPQKNEATF